MPTFRDLLNTARSNITEVLPDRGGRYAEDRPGPLPLTSASRTSSSQGALKGAVHIPRGFLEIQVAGPHP